MLLRVLKKQQAKELAMKNPATKNKPKMALLAFCSAMACLGSNAFALDAAPDAPAVGVQAETPDVLIKRLSMETVRSVKSDSSIAAGDINKIIALVDTKIMPNVNFQRMTASAVGHHWIGATAEQKKVLQEQFKILLVRTYAGALSQLKDNEIKVKPLRAGPQDKEVTVRTEVKGSGDPLQLDYRLEKMPDQWRIYDINVMGIWLVETYKNQFSATIKDRGIDGLVAKLKEMNLAAKKG
jgi:phospholipid transport system substrate-binding protein